MNWHVTKLNIVKIFPFLNPFLRYLNFLTSNIQEVDDPTPVTVLKKQPYDRSAV